MQDLLSLLVCSNEKTGLQVGIRYEQGMCMNCMRAAVLVHFFFVVGERHVRANFHAKIFVHKSPKVMAIT